ncbi:Ctr copper transporter family-domain-containing protein [Tricharina praecox]|uniref:Ctr copper transporter family-domain-containing protein n=1 Tax=Tricharina praecox TaxID=43433 RepID=UPI00221FA054|nr:Ctr copper transporter family-domain-containing protein [Tricharina praecox]KAI5858835.1 Ctr copper transporter family-domain-containing protein [Tricharina praecox]
MLAHHDFHGDGDIPMTFATSAFVPILAATSAGGIPASASVVPHTGHHDHSAHSGHGPHSANGDVHGSGMAHGHGMAMTFTTKYTTPLLFSRLVPTTPSQAVGFGITIFVLAFTYRALVFLRAYLEAVYWSPKPASPAPTFGDDVGGEKSLRQRGVAQDFDWMRETGRMLLTALTSMIGYVIMLIVMSLVVVNSPRPQIDE